MSQHLQDKKRIYKPGKSQYALECVLWPIGSSLTLFEIWERGADVPLGCLGGQSALPWSAENFHGGRSVSSAQAGELEGVLGKVSPENGHLAQFRRRLPALNVRYSC